jgi:hypothetical protein
MSVQTVLQAYRRHHDFEDARDELHALGPAAMREVLDVALARGNGDELGLLVMALSDVLYPPAMPAMREWLEHADIEQIALPAASALDRAAGGRFEVDRYWAGDWTGIRETFAELAAWWDAGEVVLPSEAEWLAERTRKRQAQQHSAPPPSPALGGEQQAAMRPALIALVQDFNLLDPGTQHALEHQAVTRVLPIWRRFAPADRRLSDAMDVIARFLRGAATQAELAPACEDARACIEAARAVAAWNPAHHGWMRPDAKAAADVAQAVVYLCSPEPRNRLQGLHLSRDALEWSGGGADAVRAELAWQHEAVGRGRG